MNKSKPTPKNDEKEINQLIDEIKQLKREKKAVLLAHYYQTMDIQNIADHLGDSLGLSKTAQKVSDVDMIVFAGVYFMAETAKILNPEIKVIIPDANAGCPLANQCGSKEIAQAKEKHGEDIPVVVYVNTTAETKAAADLTCTSSNAVEVVKKLNVDKVIFGPDKNLAWHVQSKLPEIEIIPVPENGHCYVHTQFDTKSIAKLTGKYPNAVLMAHPECNPAIQQLADFVGSTAKMLNFAKETDAKTVIVATEKGLSERLKVLHPEKIFLLANKKAICKDMKKITLEKIRDALLNEKHEVLIPEDITKKAGKAIKRMLELS